MKNKSAKLEQNISNKGESSQVTISIVKPIENLGYYVNIKTTVNFEIMLVTIVIIDTWIECLKVNL